MKKKFCLLLMVITFLVQLAGPSPASAQSPGDIARQYLLPGETLYTFPYPLREDGQEYYLHFYLKNYPQPSDQIISYLPNYISSGNLKGLIVTTHGQVVEDREKLGELLTLWQAGFQLYRIRAIPLALSWVDSNTFTQDMNLVMLDPLFVQQMADHLLQGKADRYRLDAWKGILHSEINPPSEWEQAGEQIKGGLDGFHSVQDAVDATVDASYNIVGRGHKIPALLKDARRMYKGWNPEPAASHGYAIGGKLLTGANMFKLFDYGMRLTWVTNLEQERADWLPKYKKIFTDPALQLDKNQLDAMDQSAAEAYSDFQQRFDTFATIVNEIAGNLIKDVTAKVFEEIIAKEVIKRFELTMTSHTLLSCLAAVDAGLTVADLMYGMSALYDNFWVAKESDNLRVKFRAGRLELEKRAGTPSNSGYYEGDLIKQYQIVYMLESLATVQMVRSYADGIEGTLSGLPSFLNPVNWFQGNDRKEAVKTLHSNATQGEIDAEEAVLYPSWVPNAVTLSEDRIDSLRLTIDDVSPTGFARKGPAENWSTAQTGYGGQAVITKNETTSSKNSATWTLTIPDAGLYRAYAYIPAKVAEIPLPYTGAAHYEIRLPSGGKAVKASQAASEGAWLNLGEFYVETGQTVTIQLYDQTGEPAGTKTVIFDAVQWMSVPESEQANTYNAAQVGSVYVVANPGESTVLEFKVQNTGLQPWIDGEYALAGASENAKEAPEKIAISKALKPGEIETLKISFVAPKSPTVITLTYQMQRNQQAFGKKVTGIIGVLPEGMGGINVDIQKLLDGLKNEGEKKLDELIKQFLESIQKKLVDLLNGLLNSLCFGTTSSIVLVGYLAWFTGRRRR
jgi:hypothetical protein